MSVLRDIQDPFANVLGGHRGAEPVVRPQSPAGRAGGPPRTPAGPGAARARRSMVGVRFPADPALRALHGPGDFWVPDSLTENLRRGRDMTADNRHDINTGHAAFDAQTTFIGRLKGEHGTLEFRSLMAHLYGPKVKSGHPLVDKPREMVDRAPRRLALRAREVVAAGHAAALMRLFHTNQTGPNEPVREVEHAWLLSDAEGHLLDLDVSGDATSRNITTVCAPYLVTLPRT